MRKAKKAWLVKRFNKKQDLANMIFRLCQALLIMMNKNQLKQHGIDTETNKIQCPDCEEWSTINEWDSDVFSWGDCEEMVAMECPKCKETFEINRYKFNCA